jgi:anti-sigma regulatory factor (Ser/Thr protein kinase)
MRLALALNPWLLAGLLLGLLISASLMSRRRIVRMRVPARLDSIRPVIALASELGRQARLSDQAIYQCRLALDEACMNIIRHAYPNNPDGEIEVVIEAGWKQCVIQLIDFGESYQPSSVPSPLIGTPLEEARPGGLGLYLMRKVMDEVRYIPGPTRNCLVMVKRG